MYHGKIAILGDAAFVARPHTGSGTAKATRDAIALANSLARYNKLSEALSQWQYQRMAANLDLVAHGKILAARAGLGY